MNNYEKDSLRYARQEVREALGTHVVMVFGGTTVYSDYLPESPRETESSIRENEGDLPCLLV